MGILLYLLLAASSKAPDLEKLLLDYYRWTRNMLYLRVFAKLT